MPALGFKTYFIRTTNNETALKGAKVTGLTPAKKIAQNVDEDIPIENDVSRAVFFQTAVLQSLVSLATPFNLKRKRVW